MTVDVRATGTYIGAAVSGNWYVHAMVGLINRRPFSLLLLAVCVSVLAINGLLNLLDDLASGTAQHALLRVAGVAFLYQTAVAAFRKTREPGASAVSDTSTVPAEQR